MPPVEELERSPADHAAQQEQPQESVDEANGQQSTDKKRKQPPSTGNDANKKQKMQNRAIFISKLPLDATKDEIAEEFKRYGIIDEGVDGQKRINMYTDDDENFKGEALVVYYKPESVDMAVKYANDYWFRPGGENISVEPAQSSFRKHKEGSEIKMMRKERKANTRNRADLHRRATEWSDDEIPEEAYAPLVNKWAKFVIMKHMFTLEELEDDPAALLEIKEDVREDAEKFGEVTNVVLYDQESSGIVSVRFKELEDARKYQETVQGRVFSGRVIESWLADDKPKYKKSKTTDAEPEEN